MDDTQLHVRIGKYALYGIGKARQTVDAGNENVSHATVPKVCQDTKPEVSALTMRHIYAQQVLATVLVNADDIVDGTRLGGAFVVAHFVMDGIHPDDGINLIQRAVAPRLMLEMIKWYNTNLILVFLMNKLLPPYIALNIINYTAHLLILPFS